MKWVVMMTLGLTAFTVRGMDQAEAVWRADVYDPMYERPGRLWKGDRKIFSVQNSKGQKERRKGYDLDDALFDKYSKQIKEHVFKKVYDVNAKYKFTDNSREYTLLHIAARCGNEKMVKFLLDECKAQPSLFIRDGWDRKPSEAVPFGRSKGFYDRIRSYLERQERLYRRTLRLEVEEPFLGMRAAPRPVLLDTETGNTLYTQADHQEDFEDLWVAPVQKKPHRRSSPLSADSGC